MTILRYREQCFPLEPNQSVLDCLSGHGVPVPYSCRVGVCQTCLLRATAGTPPPTAQAGLKDSLKLQNYFLACVCQPTEDLSVALPDDDAQPTTQAIVRALELLNHDILRVELQCPDGFTYRAGQFINWVWAQDPTQVRSYSLASVPGLDRHIQLHVRRLPRGRVSGWIHDALKVGQQVDIRGPAGDCLYAPGKPEQALLLVGTGTGLAPLYGIARDALAQGHSGPIRLFHGSHDADGLYLAEELRALQRQHANFAYVPCLSGAAVPPGHVAGRANEAALREIPHLKGWRVYLCGHPDMVKATKKKAFLAGASMQDIHADAFNVSHA
ncbi:MAG: FAD-binding oxidoreductase [Candidatus Methylumidiphilus sp.]